jgi:O-acetyl-ADP-ribose deacetylase (regulator of RNase III)
MITFTQGDIFLSKAEALVNPVNCVGVSGKGLAKEFKKRFPEADDCYVKLCRMGVIIPGHVQMLREGMLPEGKWIAYFPSKDHWRNPSQTDRISSGLDALARGLVLRKIKSVAIPALGCGNGGLAWSDVKPLIESAFKNNPEINVEVYEPK